MFNFEGLLEVFKRVKEQKNTLLKYGGVAQLGEHLPCKQGVDSSILFISTRDEGVPEGTHREPNSLKARNGLIAQAVRAHA